MIAMPTLRESGLSIHKGTDMWKFIAFLLKLLDKLKSRISNYEAAEAERQRLETRKQELASRAVVLKARDFYQQYEEWAFAEGNFSRDWLWTMHHRDSRIWAVDVTTMVEIIQEFWLPNKLPYVVNRYDCEDFGESFRSFLVEEFGLNQAAYAESVRHGFNTLVFPPVNDVYIFKGLEPQEGNLWDKVSVSGNPDMYRELTTLLW